MEAGRNLISPPPMASTSHVARAPFKRSSFSPCPVLMINGQAGRPIPSAPLTSATRHLPSSVALQDQHNDFRSCTVRDDSRSFEVALLSKPLENKTLIFKSKADELDEYLKYFERLLPSACCLPFPNFNNDKILIESHRPSAGLGGIIGREVKNDDGFDGAISPSEVLELARKAVLASREAASLAESHSQTSPTSENLHSPVRSLNDQDTFLPMAEDEASRSKRLTDRRLRRRKRSSSKTANMIGDASPCRIPVEVNRKISRAVDNNDAFRFFLWGPETRQLLTVKEEKDLFKKIQELMRLEEMKAELQTQFGREPTLVEWAEAVGMTCHVLQSFLHTGNRSRERMIYANFRLVVHVAKQYQGRGLNIQDLLQEGSVGLMKSLEKFKPKAGCRFPTYAYWWIRQSIRKAIFQNSRTIRLPENVFALLKKIKHTKRLYMQEGYVPTYEELAKRVGITKERLERVLASARSPISIQDNAWADQDVTVQEITADPEVEAPELMVAKEMMRRHVRGLLRGLPLREQQIVQFRFGLHGGEPMSLSEIGELMNLSKERIRQLESRALHRLKEYLGNQGLGAYAQLLS